MLAPARVQPSRLNRSNRMAEIMASIEDDDDSRTAVPRRKKRQIVESEAEDMNDVPEEIEHNPMAPSKKKRRQLDVENPPCSIPPLLPLQPTSPAQVPPNFRPNTKPHHTSRSQFRPQQSTYESQTQNTASNPTNQSGNLEEDDPMQEDYQERIAQG